jgi:hypothetical protein
MTQDKVGALCGGGERQPFDAIAEFGVGLHHGVLRALGLFPALPALGVCDVDLRPPGCEEDWISITVVLRLLA